MSSLGDIDEESSRRSYGRPYTSKHPVPTIQGYREHRADLKERLEETEAEQNQHDAGQDSKFRRAYDSVRKIVKEEDTPQTGYDPYPTSNRNIPDRPTKEDYPQARFHQDVTHEHPQEIDRNDTKAGKNGDHRKSATEVASSHVDPKQKRQDMKKIKRTGGGREVTDPVTHLPIIIHDQTDKDLNTAPENEPTAGSQVRTFTGLSGASKDTDQLEKEQVELQRGYEGMRLLFPPPAYEDTKKEFARTYHLALAFGLGSIVATTLLALIVMQLINYYSRNWLVTLIAFFVVILGIGGAGFAITMTIAGWLSNKVNDIWDDETWDAARSREIQTNESDAELPESVAWLNSVLASVWPLINPDLFTSLVDMLEDVMQASLPRMIRMVSIDDLGQGSEAIRILGIRWLPTGAASQSVDDEGNLRKPKEHKTNDRTTPGEGEIESDDENTNVDEKPKPQREDEQQRKQRKQEQEAIREGMEAEEGDFMNMELAFAYRARSSGKSLKAKVKNAHLYLKFYLPGGIVIPIWVELRGIIGTMRLRLQLTPDPPFFSLCTLTFLGQPRANLSCVPLSKHSLNIMDIPLISSFVQSAIDAALAEYVAPKSLTLDLKDMLVGDDFKKDTITRGVVLVFIKKARDFKEGDGGIGPFRGSSDSYVTVSWGKFGKPVASTRIIVNSQEPDWHEWASILVSPDELNAQEKLRVQLWDSDKLTADDDLGRVELDLKELMHNSDAHNKMCDRDDQFKGEDPEEDMPGKLTWSVGYFSKARILQSQLEKQTVRPDIRNKEALKEFVTKQAEHKLREAMRSEGASDELHQQKVQDYKEEEDAMIISTPPPSDFPSGIFSIQIHNITGLEVQSLNKKHKGDGDQDHEDEAEQASGLPDSYATIILNHGRIYRTRTKPKNAKPFFNAGTERFVKDWKTAEVMISIRDSREGEDDPLLGVVYLPLRRVFEKTSQVMATYPLAGGIGYGKARISMVWRSVEAKLPPNLLGWDYGTLEVKSSVRAKEGASAMDEIKGYRIKIRTNLDKVKMQPVDGHMFRSDKGSSGHGQWKPKRDKDDSSSFLAVRKRYASCVMIEWRKQSIGPDSTPAFAVFWLSELADEEEKTVTLKVWKGGKENIRRAESCCNYVGVEEGEQPLGEIELTLKFWRGLSGYHKRYARKARHNDMRDVMEVLDTVSDEKMDETDGEYQDYSSDSDSDSDFSAGSESNKKHRVSSGQHSGSTSDKETKKKLRARPNRDPSDVDSGTDSGASGLKRPVGTLKKKVGDLLDGDSGDEDDGTRGLRGQVQDYKKHHRQLHRQHRGVMQWKSARTLDWMLGKFKRGKGRVEGVFEHSEKDQGIETEV